MRNLIISVFFLSLFSCKGFDAYKKHDHLFSVSKRNYSDKDLIISDYYFCSHQRQMVLVDNVFDPLIIETDSILRFFYQGISNQGINLILKPGENNAIPRLCNREVISLNKVRKELLDKLNINDTESRYLVPLINIADIYRFTGYMTSNFVAGDEGFMRYTSLSLLVFIIENDKIIYATKHRYASKRTFANSLEEVRAIPPAYQVREEHIEELVRRAMKRYIKRLK